MAVGIHPRKPAADAPPAVPTPGDRSSGEKKKGRPNPPRRVCSCLRCRDIVFAWMDGGRKLRLTRPCKSSRTRIRKRFRHLGIRLSGCQSFGTARGQVHGKSCTAWNFAPVVTATPRSPAKRRLP
jgi:hypothetical protein